MTDDAAAVIPEVLAGQILSLARRGGRGTRHTILAATTDDSLARDRLVVLLQPDFASEHDGDISDGLDGDHEAPIGDKERTAGRIVCQRKDKSGSLVAVGMDERPRHALVIPCVPGQVRGLLLVHSVTAAKAFGLVLLSRTCGSPWCSLEQWPFCIAR